MRWIIYPAEWSGWIANICVGGFVEFGVEKQESLTGLLLPFSITYFECLQLGIC